MSKKVLIIDDEEGIVNLVKAALTSKGYEVESSGDGEEGLQMALKNDYDLILLDLGLPSRDGQSICLELKLDSQKKDVPIIMLTGRSIEQEKEIGESMGADEYLPKPFDIKTLLDVVDRTLNA